jgi:hypothetical protein
MELKNTVDFPRRSHKAHASFMGIDIRETGDYIGATVKESDGIDLQQRAASLFPPSR